MSELLDDALEATIRGRKRLRYLCVFAPWFNIALLGLLAYFTDSSIGLPIYIITAGLVVLGAYVLYLNEKVIKHLQNPEIGWVEGVLKDTKKSDLLLRNYSIGERDGKYGSGYYDCSQYSNMTIRATVELNSRIILKCEKI